MRKPLGRDRLRRDRMAEELVALRVGVAQRSERPLVEHHLGALIDDGALRARERQPVRLAFEEILPHLRADLLEDEAKMRRDRIVAQDRVPGLHEIAQAERGERAEQKRADDEDALTAGAMLAAMSARHRIVRRTAKVRTKNRGVNASLSVCKISLPACTPSAGATPLACDRRPKGHDALFVQVAPNCFVDAGAPKSKQSILFARSLVRRWRDSGVPSAEIGMRRDAACRRRNSRLCSRRVSTNRMRAP